MSLKIPRRQYADLYGPTTGDRVRLADTELFIEIEKDLTTPGDEAKFGGGKSIRDGMGQSSTATCDDGALDLVITNAVIVDHGGIYKADIGIRNGRIAGIGKAGNPDIMGGVTPGMIIGAGTEVLAGEGKIVTAGGIDAHVHFICPKLVETALSGGLTTLIGGGTGPATGTDATTCTPGPWNMHRMLESADGFPINLGFLGKGNSSTPEPLREQIEAGAIGLKLHEDWGTTPAAIDCALSVAEEFDVQVAIHTDTINESGYVQDSIRAFKGRTIHTYHTEGAGGGHAPDIIKVCGEPNCLPSSTNPTMPFTINTLNEHLDMLMVCHHLSPSIPEDVAFAESRIRAETIAAEDVLHDLGAISMMSSDSQAMGRIGEVVTRTWQTADKMKRQRGPLPGEKSGSDNVRVRRYVAKYTINPAMIIKGGMIAWSAMGDANASIPTPQPVIFRPMFGSFGGALHSTSLTFLSRAAVHSGLAGKLGLKKKTVAVNHCRGLTKRDMINNDALPRMEVDPDTYEVRADGVLLTCAPAEVLPMAQRYFLF